MKAGPKAAVDPTVLPFRPQSTGAARPLYVRVIASEITGRRFSAGALRHLHKPLAELREFQVRPRTGSQNNHRLTTVAARRGPEIVTQLCQLTALKWSTSL